MLPSHLVGRISPHCWCGKLTMSAPPNRAGSRMPTPEELLDQTETDLLNSDYDEELSGIDRRQFMFLSLVAAAATAFGADRARAQGVGGAPGAAGAAGGGRGQQPQAPPVPLGNGEAPALQFQPYPGGTGALMEKLAKERGHAAFERAGLHRSIEVGDGAGADRIRRRIAFLLPAHRLSAGSRSSTKKILRSNFSLRDLSLRHQPAESDGQLLMPGGDDHGGFARAPKRWPPTQRSRPVSIAAHCTASRTA